MAGTLCRVTVSGVSNTAHKISRASFFAPCGIISPFKGYPPSTTNEVMKKSNI
jgi:hypothetical protein